LLLQKCAGQAGRLTGIFITKNTRFVSEKSAAGEDKENSPQKNTKNAENGGILEWWNDGRLECWTSRG